MTSEVDDQSLRKKGIARAMSPHPDPLLMHTEQKVVTREELQVRPAAHKKKQGLKVNDIQALLQSTIDNNR